MKRYNYFIGIGSFGYAVFYTDDNGEDKRVSKIYRSMNQALITLRQLNNGSKENQPRAY